MENAICRTNPTTVELLGIKSENSPNSGRKRLKAQENRLDWRRRYAFKSRTARLNPLQERPEQSQKRLNRGRIMPKKRQ
jgi:hypothetical protein